MQSWTISLFLGICFLANIIDGAPDSSCKAFVASLTKKQLGGISSCSKKLKFKSPKEKAAKMNCILKCVLIKEKLLDANGAFVEADKFEDFLNELIPGNLLDKAGPKFRHCRETTADKLQPGEGDPFCKSYDPLIKCMLDVIGTLCK